MKKNFKPGSVLSETSHYKVLNVTGDKANLRHLEGKANVSISLNYLQDYCLTADDFESEVAVTRDDKKDGTKGIRNIFADISGEQVFTVCFTKLNTPKTKKKIAEEKAAIVKNLEDAINKAKAQHKSISKICAEHVEAILADPILDYEPGEERVLRGYKIGGDSITGFYKCVDMDAPEIGELSSIRQVNINTIKYLIHDGTKYVVK